MLAASEAERTADWIVSGVPTLTGRQDGPALMPPGFAASRARRLAAYLAGVGIDVDGPALLAERAALAGYRRRGPVSVGGSCRLLPTLDGWAAVSCARPDDPLLLGALVGAELPADPWPPVAAWVRTHPGTTLAERAELLGLAAAPVYEDRVAAAGEDVIGAPRAPAGQLVVDFSALWAGPLCAHLLGLGGAQVVKVETAARPDGARRGNAAFYSLLHAGHRSVVVDPQDPADRRLLHALVEAADIVIEASRPRALAAWGLSPAGTGATWVSITAAGRSRNRIGFGDDIAAGAGLVARDAAGPVFVGDAIADPLAGLFAAARAVAAMPGDLVEVDMTAVVAATLVGTEAGELAPVAEGSALPRAREPRGDAPALGADTAAIRRELRC